MRKLTTLLMALMLMSTALWASETVTVSANSSDISEGLDLKVVAKLFAEAKNLEEFETMLNNPDSAFCNLDLNGDGQVDYLRVVEVGEGNKRLVVLQAILAKDIFQDVASIYVEKDEANNVSVQIVGDEYVYGTNYIIEPIYVYRPVIYDWFWSAAWCAWHSPWYWGYYPGWWYVHSCWSYDWYWHHCYAFHHHHHYCSFRPGHHIHHGYHDMHHRVSHREYAVAHPDHSFARRNSGMTNAREIRNAGSVRSVARSDGSRQINTSGRPQTNASSRTFGSQNTVSARSQGAGRQGTPSRTISTNGSSTSGRASGTHTQSSGRSTTATATRSTNSSSRSTTATATRSTGSSTSTRSTSATTTRSTSATATRSTNSSSRSTVSSQPVRSSSSGSSRSSGSTYSGSSSRGSGGFSGGSSRGGGSSSGGRGGGSVRR